MSIWPHAETPKSYVLFTGMAMLGAALGRQVVFDQDVHKLYPMLNLLLIGPSGIGKTTALEHMGMRLLHSLPKAEQPQIISGAPTPEKLHDDLKPNPHAVLFAEELASFFNKTKYMEGLIPYVTELLNYKSHIERRTKGGGLIIVDNPTVAVCGGSTVEWLQEQLPDSATSGGFLARFLIVSEEHKSQRNPLPKMSMGKTQWLQLEHARAKCFNDFYHCLRYYSGSIAFRDYGVADVYSLWYSNYKPATGHLAPFSARAGEFILRLATLVALSRHNVAIDDEDVTAAIKLYTYCADKLQAVVVPYTQQGKLSAMVMKALDQPRTPQEVRHAMKNFAGSREVDKILMDLQASGDVSMHDGKYRRAGRDG